MWKCQKNSFSKTPHFFDVYVRPSSCFETAQIESNEAHLLGKLSLLNYPPRKNTKKQTNQVNFWEKLTQRRLRPAIVATQRCPKTRVHQNYSSRQEREQARRYSCSTNHFSLHPSSPPHFSPPLPSSSPSPSSPSSSYPLLLLLLLLLLLVLLFLFLLLVLLLLPLV